MATTNVDDFFKQQTPSSRIKANIVADYFPKYCKIINKSKQKEIRYVDLYAGPGKYDDGNFSTPLLIGKACASDEELKSLVYLMFNDNAYSEKLKQNFLEHFPNGTFKNNPIFGNKTVGDDEQITKYLTKKWGKTNQSPTLLFVDPFGYKSINTNALANFMNGWGNEIFLFLNIKRIQAALDNNKFDELMTSLFPTTVEKLRMDRKYKSSVHERLSLIVDNLFEEFQKVTTGTLYHCRFKFKEEDSIGTSHYIIHFTKHHRGYDLVKQIYHEFDNIGASLEKDGNYTFDAKKLDIPENCIFDFGDSNVESLSKILLAKYSRTTITAKKLFEEHQKTSQFAGPHYLKTLRKMVEDNMVEAKYLDGKQHKKTVLLIDNCELKFK
ncbi:three-Cys-motif partner protein [Flavobacterium gossypii]|uniref:Three-Cys-motif partner protein n=1 Tax=Flavobacterium gossypii TaxID=1646119 RepID=A0ABR6DR58_9FLAO|nr:three-Cys-motif partner protein TcmP [Flavobacterium gossypii]MBA9074163.1 three-Cys-motif partner protein [Flavobacterium gossypii]